MYQYYDCDYRYQVPSIQHLITIKSIPLRIDFDLITAATFGLTRCKKNVNQPIFVSNLRSQTRMAGLGRPIMRMQL